MKRLHKVIPKSWPKIYLQDKDGKFITWFRVHPSLYEEIRKYTGDDPDLLLELVSVALEIYMRQGLIEEISSDDARLSGATIVI